MPDDIRHIDVYNPVLYEVNFKLGGKGDWKSYKEILATPNIPFVYPYGPVKSVTVTDIYNQVNDISLALEVPWGDSRGNIVDEFLRYFYNTVQAGTYLNVKWGYLGYDSVGYAEGMIKNAPVCNFGPFTGITIEATGGVLGANTSGLSLSNITVGGNNTKDTKPPDPQAPSDKAAEQKLTGTVIKGILKNIAKDVIKCPYEDNVICFPNDKILDSWIVYYSQFFDMLASNMSTLDKLNDIANKNGAVVTLKNGGRIYVQAHSVDASYKMTKYNFVYMKDSNFTAYKTRMAYLDDSVKVTDEYYVMGITEFSMTPQWWSLAGFSKVATDQIISGGRTSTGANSDLPNDPTDKKLATQNNSVTDSIIDTAFLYVQSDDIHPDTSAKEAVKRYMDSMVMKGNSNVLVGSFGTLDIPDIQSGQFVSINNIPIVSGVYLVNKITHTIGVGSASTMALEVTCGGRYLGPADVAKLEQDGVGGVVMQMKNGVPVIQEGV
jgi:hypothetical protein